MRFCVSWQESLLAEQRSTFEVKQAAAQVKLEAEEKVKAKERVMRRKLIKGKDADRQRVFVQMKQRLEDRRQTFLDEQGRREHMLQLVQVKLARERELKREELRLKAIAKTEMVRKARRIEEYERTQAMDRLLANEKKQAIIKQNRVLPLLPSLPSSPPLIFLLLLPNGSLLSQCDLMCVRLCTQENLLRERKRLQRQALIERSQMLESLEQLRTYGGRPDATLMALLGDDTSATSTSSAAAPRALEAPQSRSRDDESSAQGEPHRAFSLLRINR